MILSYAFLLGLLQMMTLTLITDGVSKGGRKAILAKLK